MIVNAKEELKIIEGNFWALTKYDGKTDFEAYDNVDKGGPVDSKVCTRKYKLRGENNIGIISIYDIYDVRAYHKSKYFSGEIKFDDLLNNIDEKKKADEILSEKSGQLTIEDIVKYVKTTCYSLPANILEKVSIEVLKQIRKKEPEVYEILFDRGYFLHCIKQFTKQETHQYTDCDGNSHSYISDSYDNASSFVSGVMIAPNNSINKDDNFFRD